ncbi:ABC transporter permease [Neisseria sp. ZJ106]|uniref:ABC transporter permease n=1 Tax=Neisseria lisongii TaxID=2912188 RepID=A0AAW5AQH8_9NEIS|nr:ABC transporter permease [Neisseria lisongii]MCF7521845.1 ABC transporter permease [Neisseria lisongii]MCF7530447.1 ABC transporter permease [Neisseria lisongii]WCL71779.1 ABC transporter permease [Neisseria lisongii]
MNPIAIITGKEVRDSLRNRWVLAAALLLAALALSLGFLGSAPTGSVKVDPLTVTVVSLSSLSIFLIPLIAMLLAYDALIGEIERGTMALLLSYPISRHQILAGKFLGHLIILTLATTLGYGLAGITLQLAHGGGIDVAAWKPFALLITASVVLGAAFLAMGYLISAKVKERGTAAGIAIGVWLFFVVIFDMALMGILVADSQQILTAPIVETVLLFNPTDIYRLLNLTGYENTAMYAGMAGLSEQISLSVPVLLAAQFLWVIIPLLLAAWIFGKRQI